MSSQPVYSVSFLSYYCENFGLNLGGFVSVFDRLSLKQAYSKALNQQLVDTQCKEGPTFWTDNQRFQQIPLIISNRCLRNPKPAPCRVLSTAQT